MLKHPFLLLFVIFGVVGILVATNQVKTPQIFMPKANVVGVSLSVLPSQMTLDQGQETSFDILLDSAGQEVSAVELSLVYASSVIQVTDITPSEKLPQVIGKDLSKAGQANVILLGSPGSITNTGGVIAKVSVKAVGVGKSAIKFDTNTKVSAVGKTGDVLVGINPAEIEVKGNGGANVTIPDHISTEVLTDKADQLINDYLTQEGTVAAEIKEEGSFVARYTKALSNYIKGAISNINLSVEDRAKSIMGE